MRARVRCMTAGAVFVLLAPFVDVTLQAQRVTQESIDALQRWGDAVKSHKPGRPDDAVQVAVAMTYAARVDLNTSFPLFMRALREDAVATKSELEGRVTAYARTIRDGLGSTVFLKRAAVLHADAVVFADRFPRPPDDAPPIVPEQGGGTPGDRYPIRPAKVPPLLTNERIVLTRDGEVIGEERINWNLPFARSLLDALLKDELHPVVPREDKEFVAGWYHAVAAYLFARGLNGDAKQHLEQGVRLLPDDAHMLFDRGTYAEWFGLPIYQALGSQKVVAEEKTNAEAERQYRRALEADPSYVEARVRLARLLERRGRLDEAAAEIGTALEAKPDGAVAFFAAIVAGRIAGARGRYDEALRFYRDASALHAGAQSALLGASHAALMIADRAETLAPLASLGGGATESTDPWLEYAVGSGRDVNTLLTQLWARTSKP